MNLTVAFPEFDNLSEDGREVIHIIVRHQRTASRELC